ncbi:MAG: pantoate--beta-alanine ligase [Planctomycetota bacterium]
MEVVEKIESVRTLVRQARTAGRIIGFVPTMGALHEGHVSLINHAVAKTGYVVVSIFVNPTQFGPNEDIEKYPRPFDADITLCRSCKVDLVFHPAVREMYPTENLTWVNVEKLSEPLCGRNRPTHFRGVATVCTKLFNIVQPDIVFFGQKDAQQAIIVKTMAADLNMPLEVIICPTIRELSGLAISSRNRYLTGRAKADAAALYTELRKCEKKIRNGITDSKALIARMTESIARIPNAKIDYISIVNARTLEEVHNIEGPVLIALAVWIGPARLIDNILVDLNKQQKKL